MPKLTKLQSDLLREKFTAVCHEAPEDMEFGAPHRFEVFRVQHEEDHTCHPHILAEVNFQKGPIQEDGINGIHNEDLIAMVICRLEHFQKGQFSCRENALAITKLEEAMMWLRKRTDARVKRGVEGTSEV